MFKPLRLNPKLKKKLDEKQSTKKQTVQKAAFKREADKKAPTKRIIKPPLGIVPKDIWDFQRFGNMRDAITRYLNAALPIKKEWITEYNDLISKLPKQDGIDEEGIAYEIENEQTVITKNHLKLIFSNDKFINNVCLSCRHDFGLLKPLEQKEIRFRVEDTMNAILNNLY